MLNSISFPAVSTEMFQTTYVVLNMRKKREYTVRFGLLEIPRRTPENSMIIGPCTVSSIYDAWTYVFDSAAAVILQVDSEVSKPLRVVLCALNCFFLSSLPLRYFRPCVPFSNTICVVRNQSITGGTGIKLQNFFSPKTKFAPIKIAEHNYIHISCAMSWILYFYLDHLSMKFKAEYAANRSFFATSEHFAILHSVLFEFKHFLSDSVCHRMAMKRFILFTNNAHVLWKHCKNATFRAKAKNYIYI